MPDLPRLPRSTQPDDPAPSDLTAVVARSRQSSRRRRAFVGGVAAAALATAAVTVAVVSAPSAGTDRPGPAAPTPPPSTTAGRVVQLHFTAGCGDISPVARRVDGPVVEAALRALLAGPTDQERAAGVTSTFGPATGGLLRSVRTRNGSAYVDLDGSLRDRVSTTSDTAGCSNFAEQVGGTLRQFGGIAAVYYAYDGDPADFVASAGGSCPATPEPGGLCDPEPFRAPATQGPDEQAGVKAPPSSRISRTDEFGVLTLVAVASSIQVDVDRVDMLGGAEAETAARARGDEVSNDYYLVDDDPRLRRYQVSRQAVVWGSLGLGGTVEPQRVPLGDLLTFLRTDPVRSSTLFHLEVQDGVVVGVEEQYRP